MPIKIVEKREKENNREYAYRLLRHNIMTLQLLPGTTLNEGELTDLLSISRTPIHEAILMLKEETLVDVYPQSGSRVSLIHIDILKEGYFLRSVIEPEIIRQLAGNVPGEKMECLKQNLDRQKEALHAEDKIDSFFKLDDKFHHLIYSAAGKDITWYAVKKVSSHYDRVRYLDAIVNQTDLEGILMEHKDIAHILLLGMTADFDLKHFYDRHLGTYRKHFQGILEEYPGYFHM
ncbi:GntR family transcriptional regulator [Lactonifactor longoviformis]|uniref:GntR family transcriptional regulator n=1 Tax=Lactonifactor TaxID=420345 RepID=UPI0012B0137A|nr:MULTISPECIES: GntR family transcriptional regulator [Lactonifactor]MCB5714269.1 GntR family transcriptional regulator [Lactonifactor longoviformis]MCB5718224.1 GntR family transcriptional regulator [Lactonifactor longoviformis]MCQ4671686.1 GntR family transcriptional regulator [Lactonifactor longoviformis]MSA03636.1 FCD domain-containing protein [Lactonifactor sp. BIOML-A5]MSA10137.1 FCD domain-containing protein [Lactonifactor sp. BIOML-A4]